MIYAHMVGMKGPAKWEPGWYLFPAFDINSHGLVIEDFVGDTTFYTPATHHSLRFEGYLTRESALRLLVTSLMAHYKAKNISWYQLMAVVEGGHVWDVKDKLHEGGKGVSVPMFVMDEGLLFDGIKEVAKLGEYVVYYCGVHTDIRRRECGKMS